MSSTVKTGKCRLSFPNLFEPRAVNEGDKPKYGCSLIIPKSDKAAIKAIEKAIAHCAEANKGKFKKGKVPTNLKHPLRDGDEDREDDEAYEDCMFINANSAKKPQCVQKVAGAMEVITEVDILYSGCYVKAMINFFVYNTGQSEGVAAGLNGIFKVADGEPLGAVSNVLADFADEDDTEEDDDDFAI